MIITHQIYNYKYSNFTDRLLKAESSKIAMNGMKITFILHRALNPSDCGPYLQLSIIITGEQIFFRI